MSKELFISLTDPNILNKSNSPLLQIKAPIEGFKPVNFWQSIVFGREAIDPDFATDPIMQQAEANFNLFVKDEKKSNSIPPIIHFIWIGPDKLPQEFMEVINMWEICNPGWEIKIWGNEDLPNFSWSNRYLKWVFDQALTFGEKSDILRCEILYQYGGVYTDIDMICLKSLTDLINSPFTFFAGQETAHVENGNSLYVSNSIIGASKNNPLIETCMELIVSQEEAVGKSVMERTGPGLLTRVCSQALKNKENLLILPCSYFYPLPHFKDLSHKLLTAREIKEKYIAAESFTLHLWAATWYL